MKKQEIVDIWNEICNVVSGGYGFNKSHSASYAMLSFQTAYLKYYYSQYYYAALMSAEEDQAKIAEYVSECKQRGINILPPDVNKSDDKFIVTNKGINYKITSITHIGDSSIKRN